ncbi:unnamed protein product [Calypogeia fissa]
MGDKSVTVPVDLVIGALTRDIGKVVGALVSLGMSVKFCKEKCAELMEHVETIVGGIERIEEERQLKGPNSAFDEHYKLSLQRFLTVIEDCKACVQRYTQKSFFVKVLWSLESEAEFDSLNSRLDKSVKWFNLHMQVHQTISILSTADGVEEVKAEVKDILEVVKALKDDRLVPDDTQISNVEVQGSLVEGYIVAARLDDRLDVILVATEKEKKDASILKKLSNHGNILRFYGTFRVLMGTW